MSRGYRLAIIAFGLTLFAFQGHSQEAEETARKSQPVTEVGQAERTSTSEEIAGPDQENTRSPVPAIRGVETAIRDLVAAQSQEEDPDHIQRQKDDLDAQKRMALWAKWMFFAALGSVFLTGLGVLLIWRTLLYTRDAANHASNAVSQATRANDIAERAVTANIESMWRIERAYLFFGDDTHDIKDGGIVVYDSVINHGKTPAVIKATHWEVSNQEPAGEIAIYDASRTEIRDNVIAPEKSIRFGEIPVNLEKPFLFGFISYVDVFQKTRTSRFCGRWVNTKEEVKFIPAGSPVYNEWD
ncbi:MAG: hypothetical protein KF769_10470 [Parvibaculum sp.]|nr:hypothetical protein [Parvibaculum sp.]